MLNPVPARLHSGHRRQAFPTIGLAMLAALACASPLAPKTPRAEDPREANAWFSAGRSTVAAAAGFVENERPARNVILFVGDGMGVSTVTAARILEGQRRGEVRGDLDAAFLAEIVIGALNVSVTHWLVDPEYPLEERMRQTAAFLTEAIQPRASAEAAEPPRSRR